MIPATPTSIPEKGKEIDSFRQHLKARGLKMTRERRRVLEEISAMAGHFRPDDLLVRFRTRGIEVSRATIYRTLELLVSSGLVIREVFPGTGTHYERAHEVKGHSHHDHLYCTGCSAIFEFHNEEIERLQEMVCEEFGFKAQAHTHSITGLCRRCRQPRRRGAATKASR